MIHRNLKVLILGEVPEVGDIFDRLMFTEELPVEAHHVPDYEACEEALEASDNYDLIVLDLEPHGLEILEQAREYRPTSPVLAVVDPDQSERLLEAQRQGLESYVLRTDDLDLNTDLLAETIRIELKRFVEPPTMERPTADEMYRYAHFHNVIEPFFVVSRRRHLLYLNRTGSELLEQLYDRTPAVGDEIDEWSLETDADASRRHLDRAFAGHEAVTQCNFAAEVGDEEGVFELYYQPVVDPAGRVVAVSLAVHEPGRPQLQRARTSQAVTRFAGGVAHQINNLLNVLTLNVELLGGMLGEENREEVRDRVERIRHGVERTAHLTHQIQAYSRTAVTHPEELSIAEVVAEIDEQLRELAGEEIGIEFDLADGVPSVRVDRGQLQTAVRSLVANAVEANEEGGVVRVRTYHRRIQNGDTDIGIGDGTYAIVEVEDEGEGIEEDVRDRIFEPFFTTRLAEEHVGLGLAIVRTVVEQAGGGVEVESTPGDGTTVRAYFPTRSVEPPPGEGEIEEVDDPTVLLVEDDEDLRASYGEILRLDGYTVHVAADGQEAMEVVRTTGTPIDLVVTDVVLPDGRGTALAQRLVEQVGGVPFIFISGYGEAPADEIDCLECGPTVYLSKPFRVEDLLETVGDLLTRRSNGE